MRIEHADKRNFVTLDENQTLNFVAQHMNVTRHDFVVLPGNQTRGFISTVRARVRVTARVRFYPREAAVKLSNTRSISDPPQDPPQIHYRSLVIASKRCNLTTNAPF